MKARRLTNPLPHHRWPRQVLMAIRGVSRSWLALQSARDLTYFLDLVTISETKTIIDSDCVASLPAAKPEILVETRGQFGKETRREPRDLLVTWERVTALTRNVTFLDTRSSALSPLASSRGKSQ